MQRLSESWACLSVRYPLRTVSRLTKKDPTREGVVRGGAGKTSPRSRFKAARAAMEMGATNTAIRRKPIGPDLRRAASTQVVVMLKRLCLSMVTLLLVHLGGAAPSRAGEEGENAGGGSQSSSAWEGVIHRPTPPERQVHPDNSAETPMRTELLPKISRPLRQLLAVVLRTARIKGHAVPFVE